MNFGDSILDFLRAVQTPIGRLIRIEGLVVITSSILLLMSILDSFRRRSRRPIFKLILLILDTVTTSMVTYTIGLIQSSSFENELLQVWAVLLNTLKESIDDISVYGIEQEQDRRRVEIRKLMESFWVAYLNATRGSMFKYPLWLLWGFNILKIIQRIISFEFATRSYGIGKNPMLVADYMKYEHELTDPDQVNPLHMRGYKYLVLGEDKQKVEPKIPEYLINLKITHENKFITLDKIWQCKGKLLSENEQLKDVCLSFAMYKLLRRRFDDVHHLPQPDHPKNRELVLRGLMSEDDSKFERPFKVIEVELAFLRDYFYTRYPIIFSKGFPLFNIALVIMVGATCWLAVGILVHFHHPHDDLVHREHGVDVGKIITLMLLIVIIAKEVWEIITYILSDWAKIVLLCKYVEKPYWQKSVFVEKVLGVLCRQRLTKPWDRKIGQYSLLKSFNYKPWNLMYKLTSGLVSKTSQGAEKCDSIPLPDEAKKTILRSLRFNEGRPTNGRSLLERKGVSEKLSWACSLETNTHSIMAWHIATSLCEMELCQRCKPRAARSLPTFKKALKRLQSIILYIKNWWRPSPFFVNLDNLGVLRGDYEIAASLSRYCAYLVVFNGDMLPDPGPTVEFIFDNAVLEARKFLQEHDSLESRYQKMMAVEDEAAETLIEKGAKLGKQLIQTIECDELRWKILAEFWAERMSYIAPSLDTDAHFSALGKGGEFVTHLWALLSHAGIFEQPVAAENT